MTHICVTKSSLVHIRACRLAGAKPFIWTNVGLLPIRRLGTKFNEILIKLHTFLFKKIHFKMSPEMASNLSRPQCVKCKQSCHWNLCFFLESHDFILFWHCLPIPYMSGKCSFLEFRSEKSVEYIKYHYKIIQYPTICHLLFCWLGCIIYIGFYQLAIQHPLPRPILYDIHFQAFYQ